MKRATKWMLAIGVAGMLTGLATAANAESSADTQQAQVQDSKQHGDKKIGHRGGFSLGQDQELLTLLKLDQATLQEQLKGGKSLAQVAEAQGVTREQLITHLQQQQEAHLAKAVEDGKLTQAQADSMKTNAATKIGEQVDCTFDKAMKPQGHSGKQKGHFGKGFGQDAELLSLLKLDEAGLKAQLQAGKSLAEVAAAQGVTREQLIAHLQQKQESQLAQAVADGKLTQAQADSKKANLAERIMAQVDRQFDANAKQKRSQTDLAPTKSNKQPAQATTL